MLYRISVFVIGQKDPMFQVDARTHESAIDIVTAIRNGEAFQGTHEQSTFFEPENVTHYRIEQVLNQHEEYLKRNT